MTLSIKNTAGALYKSQIKGEDRYCLWLRNSNVFRRRRKQSSDGAALTSAGRLFHARDAAAGKARSPKVDRRVVDTKSISASTTPNPNPNPNPNSNSNSNPNSRGQRGHNRCVIGVIKCKVSQPRYKTLYWYWISFDSFCLLTEILKGI